MTKEPQTPSEVIRKQRILDNIMVPVFFEPDLPEAKDALQEILRALLDDPDLIVERYHAEHTLSNVGHHGIRIDVWAEDGSGRQLALELQKVTDGEVYPRAVYEAATMVVHSLKRGEHYNKLTDVIVIFFTETDLQAAGKPLYLYKTMLTDEPGQIMPTAPVYLFVNGAYHDEDTKLGRLIADVMESDPAKMRIPKLRRRMMALKETDEGREKMESALEAYVARRNAEAVAEAEKGMLYRLVRDGDLSAEKAARRLDVSEKQLLKDMQAADAAADPS